MLKNFSKMYVNLTFHVYVYCRVMYVYCAQMCVCVCVCVCVLSCTVTSLHSIYSTQAMCNAYVQVVVHVFLSLVCTMHNVQ